MHERAVKTTPLEEYQHILTYFSLQSPHVPLDLAQ